MKLPEPTTDAPAKARRAKVARERRLPFISDRSGGYKRAGADTKGSHALSRASGTSTPTARAATGYPSPPAPMGGGSWGGRGRVGLIRQWCSSLLVFLWLTTTATLASAQATTGALSPPPLSPVKPFSPVIAAQGLVFFSGQTGQDPQTQRVVSGGVEAETRRILQILQLRLQGVGLTLHDVVAVTIYLKDIAQYDQFNRAYESYFTPDFPTRTCVAVAGLRGDANVEITLIAAKKK